jgi:peptide/nickel transport system substrate-binding protein
MANEGKQKGKHKGREVSRRDFLRLTGLAAAGTIISACGAPGSDQGGAPAAQTAAGGTAAEPAAQATQAPPAAEATQAPAAAADAPTPTIEVPRGNPSEVAREESLVLMWPAATVGIGNPYAVGFNHQHGNSAWLEPLFFYSAFGEGEIPWLAESYEYGSGNQDLTIKIRNGAAWSDGTAFTAKDVAFTLNMLRQNDQLSYGADMKEWVKDAQAVDDATVKVTFNKPAPRFVFDFLSSKFDTGIFYVPEHIFKDIEDVGSFLFYDPNKGWPLVTGPYQIVDWTPQQELMDLRQDWWAAKTGFAELPTIKRIVVVPRSGDTGDTGMAQGVINNELDSTLDLRPPLMKTVLDQNPKVITHTGRDKPYGYTDWWPNSLWFNCQAEPWNDVEVRRAVNHAINRDQIVEIGYEGAGSGTVLPFPEFPSLEKYFKAAEPVLQKHPVSAYDPAKTEEIMTRKGFTKDAEGLWVGANGNRPDATIYGFDIFQDYGPVLAEQLRQAGFDASFQAPPDAYDRMATGTGHLFLFGNGAAIADVFPTFDTYYHSKRSRPVGEGGGITPRWESKEFDEIVDQMALLPVGDDKGIQMYTQALEILLRDLPAIPVVQWLHRIPYNTTYWENWPTADNSYVNGAFWHKTFPLMLHRMKKVSS